MLSSYRFFKVEREYQENVALLSFLKNLSKGKNEELKIDNEYQADFFKKSAL